MFAVIYLDKGRRVKVYEEGGFEQEIYNTPYTGICDWILANDEDWPDLPDILLKFSELLFNAHNNAKL